MSNNPSLIEVFKGTLSIYNNVILFQHSLVCHSEFRLDVFNRSLRLLVVGLLATCLCQTILKNRCLHLKADVARLRHCGIINHYKGNISLVI